MPRRHERGFALLEVLLTATLIVALMGTAAFATNVFRDQTDLDLAAHIVNQSLRSAQLFSIAGRNDGPWGVYISGSEVTIFQGDSYAERALPRDERISLPMTLDVGGTAEFVFEETSGNAVAAGTVMLANDADSASLTVGENGTVVSDP